MKIEDNTPEFIIKAPFLNDLIKEFQNLKTEVEAMKAKLNPKQEYYTITEACGLKGISSGTLSNKAYAHLKPNGGKPDAIVCGRERWSWETIQKWVRQSDEELTRLAKERK